MSTTSGCGMLPSSSGDSFLLLTLCGEAPRSSRLLTLSTSPALTASVSGVSPHTAVLSSTLGPPAATNTTQVIVQNSWSPYLDGRYATTAAEPLAGLQRHHHRVFWSDQLERLLPNFLRIIFLTFNPVRHYLMSGGPPTAGTGLSLAADRMSECGQIPPHCCRILLYLSCYGLFDCRYMKAVPSNFEDQMLSTSLPLEHQLDFSSFLRSKHFVWASAVDG